MDKLEYDAKYPIYNYNNVELVKKLAKDRIPLSVYKNKLLYKLNNLDLLYRNRASLLVSEQGEYNLNAMRRNTIAIKEHEEQIIEFAIKFSNAYYYVMAPFYVYHDERKCYMQVVGSGPSKINIELSASILKQKLNLN